MLEREFSSQNNSSSLEKEMHPVEPGVLGQDILLTAQVATKEGPTNARLSAGLKKACVEMGLEGSAEESQKCG